LPTFIEAGISVTHMLYLALCAERASSGGLDCSVQYSLCICWSILMLFAAFLENGVGFPMNATSNSEICR